MSGSSFLSQLVRRNVLRMAAAYLIGGWVLLEVSDVLFPALHLPEWTVTLVVALLLIGFIPALIFSWVYELTPQGLKQQSEVDQSSSNTAGASRRLDLVTIAFVIVGMGLLTVNYFLKDRTQGASPSAIVASLPADPASWSSTLTDSMPFIAVLPFKVIGEEEGEFLASGLHDDLLTRLAKLEAFKVISRTSMMEYRDTTKNMRDIGKELGVGYILEGAVQALGNRVRINAQLISAEDDRHLWAETYDRELTAANLFDIQGQLAVAIAGQLQTTLSKSARKLLADSPTESTEAYAAYLKGVALWDHYATPAELAEQRSYFAEAARLDPDFALAWAHLAIARSTKAYGMPQGEEREAAFKAALEAYEKASALQPDLPELHVVRANYLGYTGNYQQALAVLEAMGSSGETSPKALRLKAWLYKRLDQHDAAYLTMLEAHRLGPRDQNIAGKLVNYALVISANRCAAAGWHAETALSLAPEDPFIRVNAAIYEITCNGDAQRASELLEGIESFRQQFWLSMARMAARMERDYERLLELSAVETTGPSVLLPIRDLLERQEALYHLGRVREAADTLKEAGQLLAKLERDTDAEEERYYTLIKASYYAQSHNLEKTLHWIEEDRQYYKRQQSEPHSFGESFARLMRSVALAQVEAQDEAIEELRLLCKKPDYYTFKYFDLLPQLDSLKDHPGYIRLKGRCGDSQ
jgi:TolB-like protein